MRLRGHAIKPPPLVRGYHTSSLIPDDASSLKDISSPHWSSEALVPQFDSKTRRVTSFKHSVEPSPLSVPFLKSRSLVHAANSVIGFTAEFKRGVFGVGAATGTAFEVGPGVYLTHNHIPGELSTGPALGFPPIFKNGNQLQLIARRQHEMPLDEIQEGVPLEMISNRWTKRQSTEYLVMLKTLQQARMEGIWIPSVKYFYNWNGRITCALRGTPGDLGNILDIGFLSAARPQHKSPPTQTRLYPSRRVRELQVGMPMAALGFPSLPSSPTSSMKSREQLYSYFSGEGRELRACVGKVAVCGTGKLFDERRTEMLGVQNIIQNGSSGGPLLSSDDPNAFIGIASSYDEHPRLGITGAVYIAVDSPVVIATYLQFVLPRYDPEKIPFEMMEYFEQNQRFCQWYVEVAWQRLSEEMKTDGLRQHWSRFGNLEKPRFEKIALHDRWDGWKGLRPVYLTRPGSMLMELSDIAGCLLRGQLGEVRKRLGSLPRRANLVSRQW